MASHDKGPTELSIERKVANILDTNKISQGLMRYQITEVLQPSTLEIVNESHLHAHHAPMRGNTNPETHFR